MKIDKYTEMMKKGGVKYKDVARHLASTVGCIARIIVRRKEDGKHMRPKVLIAMRGAMRERVKYLKSCIKRINTILAGSVKEQEADNQKCKK